MSKADTIIKNPRYEAYIGKKWRKVLGINYQTYEPTLTYRGDDGKGWSLWQGDFTTKCIVSGHPLKGVKLRLV